MELTPEEEASPKETVGLEQVEKKKQASWSFNAVGQKFCNVDNCSSAVRRRRRRGDGALEEEEGDAVESPEQR